MGDQRIMVGPRAMGRQIPSVSPRTGGDRTILGLLLVRPTVAAAFSQPVDEPAIPSWFNIDSFDLGILDILAA